MAIRHSIFVHTAFQAIRRPTFVHTAFQFMPFQFFEFCFVKKYNSPDSLSAFLYKGRTGAAHKRMQTMQWKTYNEARVRVYRTFTNSSVTDQNFFDENLLVFDPLRRIVFDPRRIQKLKKSDPVLL
jgi:hypothetical protein